MNSKMNKLLLCLIMCFPGIALMPKAQAQEARVAVVQVQKILEGLNERRQIRVDLDNIARKKQAEEKVLEDQLKVLQRDLSDGLYARGTDQYKQKVLEAEKLALELQVLREYNKQFIVRESILRMQDLYRRIGVTIKEIAETRGLDLVLFSDDIPDNRPRSTEELLSLIYMRKVMYANPKLDITLDVITEMNKSANRP